MSIGRGRWFYRFGWDTRSRHRTPARILRPLLTGADAQLLDAGSGLFGLAAFLPDVNVIGIDESPDATLVGTITDLPFADRSFRVVSCIDVLEHLPADVRPRAVQELVRVASDAVLIATPNGENAERCDAEFEAALRRRGKPLPEWLVEHRAQTYPTVDSIVELLQQAGVNQFSLSFCEPTRICRIVRGAAARSSVLYAIVNLLFGAILPLLPEPRSSNAYRMIVLAQLHT